MSASTESAPVILAINRNRTNLDKLVEFLSRQGFPALPLATVDEALEVIERPGRFQLALVDIGGFDDRIWDLCERLREAEIPFLVVSLHPSVALHCASVAHGARGVLVKPLGQKQLACLIRTVLAEQCPYEPHPAHSRS